MSLIAIVFFVLTFMRTGLRQRPHWIQHPSTRVKDVTILHLKEKVRENY